MTQRTKSAPADGALRGFLPGLAVGALGVFLGLGVFTLGYGDGASYLSDRPSACTNCHVMEAFYDSWVKSSHRAVATCNDCHLSRDPVGKWLTKADNGFFHSLAFTTGSYPDPIRIKPRNRRVTQAACLHCHGELVSALVPPATKGKAEGCVRCHRDPGHALR